MRYKVIALSVGGKGSKIYHSNDIVTDECWAPGRAQELEQQGFLKMLPEEQPETEKTIDDWTSKEIKEELDKKGIKYASNEAKPDLYKKMIQ